MKKLIYYSSLLLMYFLYSTSCTDSNNDIQDNISAEMVTKSQTISNVDRIMSYNIRHCRGMDDIVDYDRIAKVISLVNPDVVALQEVDNGTIRTSRVDQAKVLAQKTGMYAYFCPSIDYQGGHYGNALLSKEKAIRTQRVSLPGDEPRSALIAEFDRYVVISTHLTGVGTEENLRIESIRILTELAKTYDKAVYLAGDFNRLYSPTISLFVEIEKDWTVSNVIKNTASTDNPRHCIDYIVALKGENSEVLDTDVIHSLEGVNVAQASDHFPLFVDFKKAEYANQYPKGQDNLRIVTHQTKYCEGTDGVIDYDLLANVYNKLDADIVCIQGLDSVTTRSSNAYQLAELAQRTNMKPYFSTAIPTRGGKYGIGILTKETPLREYRYALPGDESRTSMILDFGKYIVINTQLDSNLQHRIDAIKQLTIIAQKFYKPVFLAGYFSDEANGALFEEVKKSWTVVSVSEATYPSTNPTKQLSFILSLNNYLVNSSQGKLVNHIKGGRVHIASAHLPIYCDFAPLPDVTRVSTQYLKYCLGTDNVIDYARLAEVYNRADVDIVCFQGVDSITTRSSKVYQLGQLGKLTNLKPYFSGSISYQGGKYGVGILTKNTPLKTIHLPLPGSSEARVATVLEFSNYIVLTTHFDVDQQTRINAANTLTSFVKTFNKPVILLAYLGEDQMGKLLTQVMNADWDVVSAYKNNYPSTDPTKQMSFIMTLKNRNLLNMVNSDILQSMNGVDPKVTSTHLPIFCDFIF